eukprot:m.403867 g.403867  ORF g.403867 m.403867 type:complete len:822 (-) comp20123_c1_seq2:123-2588(-)
MAYLRYWQLRPQSAVTVVFVLVSLGTQWQTTQAKVQTDVLDVGVPSSLLPHRRTRRTNTVFPGTCDAATNCTNNGRCVNLQDSMGNAEYYCECKTDFTGDRCQTAQEECSPNPCQNGGSCSVPNAGTDEYAKYECACTAGYTGPTCSEACSANCDVCSPLGEGLETSCDTCEANYYKKREASVATCVADCGPGYTADSTNWECDEINECEPTNPCDNGGTCINRGWDGARGHDCNCDGTGYTGPDCDILIETACNTPSNPCENSGVCSVETNGYSCNCTGTGFTGTNCEYPDLCANDICKNEGTCEQSGHSFSCTCKPGYGKEEGTSGVNVCDTDLTTCDQGKSPCNLTNTASCTPKKDGPHCVCEPGWESAHCDVDTDECTPNPCDNGGTCSEPEINSYECDCGTNWIGSECQFVHRCNVDEPCANGNCTMNENTGAYSCACDAGWTSTNCDTVVSPQGSSDGGGGLDITLIIAIAIVGGVLTVVLALLVLWRIRQIRKKLAPAKAPSQVTSFTNPTYDAQKEEGAQGYDTVPGNDNAAAAPSGGAYDSVTTAPGQGGQGYDQLAGGVQAAPSKAYNKLGKKGTQPGSAPGGPGYEEVPAEFNVPNAYQEVAGKGPGGAYEFNAMDPRADPSYIDMGNDSAGGGGDGGWDDYTADSRTVANPTYEPSDPRAAITNPAYGTAGQTRPDGAISNPSYAGGAGAPQGEGEAYVDIEAGGASGGRVVPNTSYDASAAAGADEDGEDYLAIGGKQAAAAAGADGRVVPNTSYDASAAGAGAGKSEAGGRVVPNAAYKTQGGAEDYGFSDDEDGYLSVLDPKKAAP